MTLYQKLNITLKYAIIVRVLIHIITRIILVIWTRSFYRVTVNYSTMDGALPIAKRPYDEGLFSLLNTFHVRGEKEI